MKFYKLSGAGNDFIALADAPPPSAEAIVTWCQRGLSIGADGLFTLRRVANGFRMDYFNADGRRAELCLNGSRCATQLAKHLGWTERSALLHTDSGEVAGTVIDWETVALDLGPPEVPPQ